MLVFHRYVLYFYLLCLLLLLERSVSHMWGTLNCTSLFEKSFTNKVDDWMIAVEVVVVNTAEGKKKKKKEKKKDMSVSQRRGRGLKRAGPGVCRYTVPPHL